MALRLVKYLYVDDEAGVLRADCWEGAPVTIPNCNTAPPDHHLRHERGGLDPVDWRYQMKYTHTAVQEYRAGITAPDTGDPSEYIDCEDAKECWFYIHTVSGAPSAIDVQAIFYDSKESAYAKGAARHIIDTPTCVVVEVHGHTRVALKVLGLEGASPEIKMNYDLVNEVNE